MAGSVLARALAAAARGSAVAGRGASAAARVGSRGFSAGLKSSRAAAKTGATAAKTGTKATVAGGKKVGSAARTAARVAVENPMLSSMGLGVVADGLGLTEGMGDVVLICFVGLLILFLMSKK